MGQFNSRTFKKGGSFSDSLLSTPFPLASLVAHFSVDFKRCVFIRSSSRPALVVHPPPNLACLGIVTEPNPILCARFRGSVMVIVVAMPLNNAILMPAGEETAEKVVDKNPFALLLRVGPILIPESLLLALMVIALAPHSAIRIVRNPTPLFQPVLIPAFSLHRRSLGDVGVME